MLHATRPGVSSTGEQFRGFGLWSAVTVSAQGVRVVLETGGVTLLFRDGTTVPCSKSTSRSVGVTLRFHLPSDRVPTDRKPDARAAQRPAAGDSSSGLTSPGGTVTSAPSWGDAKYKRIDIKAIPNADLYQILAYATALDLPGGLLVYAKGEAEPVEYAVRHCGKRMEVATIDLAGSIEAIRSSVKSPRCAGPQVTGRSPRHGHCSLTDLGDSLKTMRPAFHMDYHMVMARREVLVQLDDDLVDRLDEIAQARGASRSALLREGARAVIDADERLAADRRLIEAYRRLPEDPALIESAARLAARTAPEW